MSKRSRTVYLDLERPSDRAKLKDPELYFQIHKNELICLDEIQRLPEIFPVLRLLAPLTPNLKKRPVKSPRLFIRDSGILHALLGIDTFDELLGHPSFGYSWEGFVIGNVLAELPNWRGYFYRTSNGNEIDLVIEKGKRLIAVECKASLSPQPTAGFFHALNELGISEAWIVCLAEEPYLLRKGVTVSPLPHFIEAMK
jgi:predicted AAA+ superfamily ATPase